MARNLQDRGERPDRRAGLAQGTTVEQPIDIRPLTALRFVAAMWVVVFHFWPNLSAAAMPAVVAKGYLGVELFFTLSGFILCHVYLDSVAAGRFGYGGFLWARLARGKGGVMSWRPASISAR